MPNTIKDKGNFIKGVQGLFVVHTAVINVLIIIKKIKKSRKSLLKNVKKIEIINFTIWYLVN